MKLNNSIGNRNQGVSLSSIKPLFPMEKREVGFQWNVRLTYIKSNLSWGLQVGRNLNQRIK